MGIVTLVTSGKGGVGKSTISAGVATAMARRGKKVLLIDCDFGLRSLDYILGVAEDLVFDLSDIILKNCEPIKSLYQCKWQKDLFLLPAPHDTAANISANQMKMLVEFLSKYFDHILLDCPAGMGKGFLRAVACATRAIVVATPDPICVRDVIVVRDALSNLKVSQVRLVINRFHPKLFERIDGFADLDQVIDTTGLRLLGVVPEDTMTSASTLSGEALSIKGPAVQAFQNIASRLDGEHVPLMNLNKVRYR